MEGVYFPGHRARYGCTIGRYFCTGWLDQDRVRVGISFFSALGLERRPRYGCVNESTCFFCPQLFRRASARTANFGPAFWVAGNILRPPIISSIPLNRSLISALASSRSESSSLPADDNVQAAFIHTRTAQRGPVDFSTLSVGVARESGSNLLPCCQPAVGSGAAQIECCASTSVHPQFSGSGYIPWVNNTKA